MNRVVGGLACAIAVASCAKPDARSTARADGAVTAGPHGVLVRLYAGMGIHGYRYDDLLPTLRALSPEAAVVTFTADDVEDYRADSAPAARTVFVLTTEASRRLRALAPPGRGAAAACGEGAFTIWLDGALLFGGLCYQRMGAAALRHPVLHIEDRDGRVELDVGAVQGAWAGLATEDATERARIDPPELRAFFAARGRLHPLGAAPASSPAGH